jgi:hypothetical protein
MGDPKKQAAATPTGAPTKKKWEKSKKRNGHHPNKPQVQPEKFRGGKDELDGNYFDCSGYGQSNRFMKTVQKIADHIGQEYKSGGITRTEVMAQEHVAIQLPTRPAATIVTTGTTTTTVPPDVMDISDYQSEKKIVDYKIQSQLENRQKIFSLVWQQCTEAMHAKVKAHREFKTIELALDGIELLRIIKLICFNIEDEKYAPQKVHETKAAFYALKQGRDSDQAYQVRFMNTVEVIEQCGASLGEDPLTRIMVCRDLGFQLNTTDATELAQITKTVRDYTLGTALILGADHERYSNMVRGLKNASLAGRDEWPKNVTEAYNYLSKWEGEESTSRAPRDYEGLSFQQEKKEPQPWHSKMTCRNCDKLGHIAAFCEEDKKLKANATIQVQDGEVHEEADVDLFDAMQKECNEGDYNHYADLFLGYDEEHRSASFLKNDIFYDKEHSKSASFFKDGINGGRIPKSWVLLDSQSTTDAFSNPKLLKDIHEVRGSLTIHTQAGKAVTKLRGMLPGYGEVWFCPNGIANILSLANVQKNRTVVYNSKEGNQFEVIKSDGEKRIFKQSKHGLYYYDMDNHHVEHDEKYVMEDAD